jgi:hypothetical protein
MDIEKLRNMMKRAGVAKDDIEKFVKIQEGSATKRERSKRKEERELVKKAIESEKGLWEKFAIERCKLHPNLYGGNPKGATVGVSFLGDEGIKVSIRKKRIKKEEVEETAAE